MCEKRRFLQANGLLAAAVRPAILARWGWTWSALVLFVAGASLWNAVDMGIGAQYRRLTAFRVRGEAGEVFDRHARVAIMGAWDENGKSTDHSLVDLGAGHWLLLEYANVKFSEKDGSSHEITSAHGWGWLFSERGDDE